MGNQLCPLFVLGYIANGHNPSPDPDEGTECLGDQCSWFEGYHARCAILDIAYRLNRVILALHEKLTDEDCN